MFHTDHTLSLSQRRFIDFISGCKNYFQVFGSQHLSLLQQFHITCHQFQVSICCCNLVIHSMTCQAIISWEMHCLASSTQLHQIRLIKTFQRSMHWTVNIHFTFVHALCVLMENQWKFHFQLFFSSNNTCSLIHANFTIDQVLSCNFVASVSLRNFVHYKRVDISLCCIYAWIFEPIYNR